jgi:hypothetical protein
MSADPTHFSITMPLSLGQAEEARRLLAVFNDWAQARVSGGEFTGEASAEDLAFFERVYNEEFEDWTGVEVLARGDRVSIDDEAGEPSVQFAGDFASALLDRFDIDAKVDLYWSGSHPGHAVITRDSITWPDEVQVTGPAAPAP